MDITDIQQELKTPDHFIFANKVILFSKVTSYDENIRYNIHSNISCGESWPSSYNIKYYFMVNCGGDKIEVGCETRIIPKHHKIWKTFKLFGFIPFKWKVWESKFWSHCSLHPTCAELEYLESDMCNQISFGEWFSNKAGISDYYQYAYKLHNQFIEKFNEYKKYNS